MINLIVFIIAVIIIYACIQIYITRELEKKAIVKSHIDGNDYIVKNTVGEKIKNLSTAGDYTFYWVGFDGEIHSMKGKGRYLEIENTRSTAPKWTGCSVTRKSTTG